MYSVWDPVKSPVGQKPHGQKSHGQKPQTNKHLNFKTNLLDIYTCNISESIALADNCCEEFLIGDLELVW